VRSLRSRAPAVGTLRYRPWRGRRGIALVAPAGRRPVDPDEVRACLEHLDANGFDRAFTVALGPIEQEPFLVAGFGVREELHLLAHDLRSLPSTGPRGRVRRPRRARSGDRPAVLAVDDEAFPPFWRMGPAGLDEALDATPSARLRVSNRPAVEGYAITGRAGNRGYLQRLAVRPPSQGHGLGASLVVDGLRWARRWGADEVLVNTQVGNDRAVRLYERLGFARCPQGLAVLERPLGGPG
jgi:GNAT superfamily N-acetyltransferase